MKKGNLILKIILINIMACIMAVGGYFGYKYYKDNQPIKTEWADIYYNFIKDMKSENKSAIENHSIIKFIEVKDVHKPIMIIDYKKDDKIYSDIYYIENNEVKSIKDSKPKEVKLLYNLEEKKYNWYVHKKEENKETYKPVSKVIKNEADVSKDNDSKNEEIETIEKEEVVGETQNTEVDGDKEYIFEIDEEITVETVDGDKMSMSKFDSVFVEPDIEINEIEYNDEMSDEELKDNLSDISEKFDTTDEITTDEVKKSVEEKEKEIITKKEEMKKAKEEEERKKAEEEKRKAEEARKKAEAEAKKGYKVGKYRLVYGTYKFDTTYMSEFSPNDEVLTLRVDGTCHYKNSGKVDDKVDTECTFKAGKILNSFEYQDGIKVYTKSGKLLVAFILYKNNFLSDQWHGLELVK